MNCPKRQMCWQSKRFSWEGAPRWRAAGEGTQENCFSMRLTVLGFIVMGLVAGLAGHPGSESFLAVHALLSQDGCQQEGSCEVVEHMESPFDFSQSLLVGGGLLVPCSLPGHPVIKQLMQMLLKCLARMGGFSQHVSPNTHSQRL